MTIELKLFWKRNGENCMSKSLFCFYTLIKSLELLKEATKFGKIKNVKSLLVSALPMESLLVVGYEKTAYYIMLNITPHDYKRQKLALSDDWKFLRLSDEPADVQFIKRQLGFRILGCIGYCTSLV